MLISKTMPVDSRDGLNAFTLVEVVMSLAISVVVIGSVWTAYITNGKIVAKTICSGAANAALLERSEQIRAARWDTRAVPLVDELSGFNLSTNVQILNLPVNVTSMLISNKVVSITNAVYATNVTTVTLITANPPLRLIRTDCTWRDRDGTMRTNTLVTYRSPSP